MRRLVHGLRFCTLLEKARLRRLDESQFVDLLAILEDACPEETSDIFRDRQPPSRAGAILFRQTAGVYLRLHSQFEIRESWSERWQLARAAFAFARGRGSLPDLHEFLPTTTFAALEEPFGHLNQEIQQPFVRYFEANGASKQYAIAVRPGWSLVESFRAVALAYPVVLWIMRWCCTNRDPTPDDAIEMVTIMDRGQGHLPLTSRQHRTRVKTLSRLEDLETLVAWYAR